MNKQSIIEQIAKMSELLKDGGAFEGEIANASAMIQKLMTKYSIEWNDIHSHKANEQHKEMAKIFSKEYSDFEHKVIKKWHWGLAGVIASATHTRNFSSNQRMVFFGVKDNAEIAKVLYALWVVNIEIMAKEAARQNIKDMIKKYPEIPLEKFRQRLVELHPEENTRYFRTSWIQGCIDGMNKKIIEQSKNELKVTRDALALYQQDVNKAYANIRSHFKKVSGNKSKGFSSSGYKQGKATGNGISLTAKPISSGRKQPKG